MPEHDPVYKVTIIPRGRALGVTMFLPERDQVSYSRRKLTSMLCGLYGGRIAEELIFGADAVTTGAANDIQRATEIARNMVTKWGLSEEMGPLMYGEDTEQPFLGHSMGMNKPTEYSDQTADRIDLEVRRILDTCYADAKKCIQDNEDILHAMADALIQYETIDADQVKELMARKPITPPKQQPAPKKTPDTKKTKDHKNSSDKPSASDKSTTAKAPDTPSEKDEPSAKNPDQDTDKSKRIM